MDVILLNTSWDGGRKGRASQPGHDSHLGPHNPLCPVGGLRASLASTQACLLSVNLCQKWRSQSHCLLSLYKGLNWLPLATSFNR